MATFLISHGILAQRVVNESYSVNNVERITLDFPFAEDINIEPSNGPSLEVSVSVNINDNEDNEVFELKSEESGGQLKVFSERDMFEKIDKNCVNSRINYTVKVPRSLSIGVESISGNINSSYYGQTVKFKSISGDIEMLFESNKGARLEAKTISGEIYSNIEIDHTDGKKGLNKIVGVSVKGNILGGNGQNLHLETISGDILLREM